VTTYPLQRTVKHGPHWLAPAFLVLWLLGTSAAALSAAVTQWSTEASLRAIKGVDFKRSMTLPGIREPTALLASQAVALADYDPVVGVSASSQHRAYLVRALAQGPKSHIVNDVLGGMPVSVTHCNLHVCTRVFTGGVPGEPLDLSQGGLEAGSMVLRAGGHRDRQDSCNRANRPLG
jgi:hypothetical protein